MKYDLILAGGTVVDGTRAEPYQANVCIKDGKIAAITKETAEAAEIVDVTGLAVTPGFIDLHTHSDQVPFTNHVVESKVAQGVTMELVGNCGSSILPALPGRWEDMVEYVRQKKGVLTEPIASVADYAKQAEAKKNMSINYGVLVGHSALRISVMGFVNRDPDAQEMEELKALLDRELSRGAFGMSLGLIYPPSAFSAKAELVELAKVIAKHDGILSIHMRNEGPRIFEAVDEVISIAEESGVHVQISHLKLMGKPQWGKSPELVKRIEDAQARGVNITCDQYPFLASSTSMTALVPHWAHEGGVKDMLPRVEKREGNICEAIDKEMDNRGGPQAVLVVSTGGRHPEWEGKFVSELSEEFGLDPVETVRKVLLESAGSVNCIYFSMNKEDMLRIMKRTYVSVGSDGSSLSYDRNVTKTIPHPRNFATFPQFFQTVREEKLLPIQDAVYKMTGLPASIIGLQDRGVLQEGKVADIAVFDPQTFASQSTFLESRERPVGMHHVIVSGKFALRDGVLTENREGKVLLK